MSTYTAIDLFSGAGGLSLGLERAGFNVPLAVDNDETAVETYRKNLEGRTVCRSLREIESSEILDLAGLEVGECNLVAGGPPCQGFSVQRRGDDHDPRNHLVVRFIEIVNTIKPDLFLMENVSGLMSKRGKPYLNRIRERAESNGYSTFIRKLNAAKYGVPQNRIRAFLVGEKFSSDGVRFQFPEPLIEDESDFLSVRDALKGLPSPPEDGSPHPDVANHYRESRMSEKNIRRLKHIPPGGGRDQLPEELQLKCHKDNPDHRHKDVYGRLAWDDPSVTLTARFDSFTRGKFGHPEENRSITLREGARIQTFPDWFELEGNREQGARQIGNAVPPKLAEEIAYSVIRAIKSKGEIRRDAGVQTKMKLVD